MIKLRANYVAIAPIDEPETSPGGIIIPDSAKDRTKQGIVKYVGPRCEYLAPLDYVIYGGYDGKLLNVEGEGRLIVVNEDYVAAKVSVDDDGPTEIRGLFYKDRNGNEINATYETVFSFLIQTIRSSPRFRDTRSWFVRDVTEKSSKSKHRIMADSRE